MVLLRKKIVILNIVLALISFNVNAQIYGIGADAVRQTAYSSTDSIYIYNVKGDIIRKGDLRVISPDSTKGYNFTWGKFNNNTKTFDSIFSTINDSVSFLDTSLCSSGGYSVRIKKGTIDTTFHTWVFINRLRMSLQKSKTGDTVPARNYTCNYLDLSLITTSDPRYDTSLSYIHSNSFSYRDPLTLHSYSLSNNPTITWESNPTDINLVQTNDIRTRVYNPPTGTKDSHYSTVYTIAFTDSFKNSGSDAVTYKSVNTRANFSMQSYNYGPDVKKRWSDTEDTASGEAPLKVVFRDSSIRAKYLEWAPSDTFVSSYIDTTHILNKDSFQMIYKYPRTYKVYLISTSPEGCTDTSKTEKITVLNAKLGNAKLPFPNAFTPDDPKYNRYFFFKDDNSSNNSSDSASFSITSIRNLHLQIFNQWGNLVYEYNGQVGGTDDRKNWQGWDGYTRLGLKAPSGIYYYTYTAIPWGNNLEKPKSNSGYVYLFR